MNFIFSLTLFAMTVATSSIAQSSMNVAGGDALGGGGSVSYSVGQLVYSSSIGSNGSVNEGVHQPFELFNTSINLIPKAEFNCSIYPNPTNNALTLEIEKYKLDDLSFQLYDALGHIVKFEKVQDFKTTIYMQMLPTGTYILWVLHQGLAVQTFKIIKN